MQLHLHKIILALSTIGILDSGYLLYTRLSGTSIVCVFSHGCDTVAKSPYSTILGIPLSLLGLCFYLAIFLLTLVEWKKIFLQYAAHIPQAILFVTALGFLSSMYFIYLQGWVIGAWCTYCIVSAITSSLLFFISLARN